MRCKRWLARIFRWESFPPVPATITHANSACPPRIPPPPPTLSPTAGPKPSTWAGFGTAKELPSGSAPLLPQDSIRAIAQTTDGYLWLAEQMGNQLVRVSTAGQTQGTPIPTERAYPAHLVVGPDRALWFTEAIGNKIGRFVPLPAP